MKAELWIGAVATGIGATAVMDLWGVLLKRAFDIPAPNYCLVGRWLLHMPGGVFRHPAINAAARKPAECPAGLIAHYTIGALFALTLTAAVPGWLRSLNPAPALLFGIVTVVFPLFIMHPAFGLGVAASKAPNPAQARLRSLMNHAVFGCGLYVSALAIRPLI